MMRSIIRDLGGKSSTSLRSAQNDTGAPHAISAPTGFVPRGDFYQNFAKSPVNLPKKTKNRPSRSRQS